MLVDRYVDAVMNRLPKADREDAQKRLREKITARLSENPSEDEIKTVLEELGNPAIVADEYRKVKRYLIGPALYDRYLSVLKIVMMIVPIVSAMIALLEKLMETTVATGLVNFLIETFADMVSSAFQGAAQAFLWVTLGFVIMERQGISEEIFSKAKQKWSIEDLKKGSASQKNRITRGEMMIAMFFTLFFTAIICFKPELIGWYTLKNEDFILVEPVFVTERLNDFLPAIVFLALIQFGIHVYKFIKKRWSFPLATINFAYNTAISVLVTVMVLDKSLINRGFIAQFAELTKTSMSQWSKLTWVVAAVFIFGCTIDSIVGFVKSKKSE